jgi:aryl-alcohol dehydrogenase-like predicted oxidoreductase
MNYRRFGRLDWQVSEIGCGMWGMGSWSGSDDEASLRSLQLALEGGCTFFDTAWGYGEGRSEALLGRLVRANPDRRIWTASKIPPKNMQWPSRRGYRIEDCFPADHVRDFVDRSLENMGLESINLMLLHVWEDDWTEADGWFDALSDLKSQGLIGGIGISINRWEPWNGVRAVRSGRIDAVQVIYNIFDQNPEDELFPACVENDVAVIARVPFDEGSLTGNLSLDSTWPPDDWRSTYFVPENLHSSVAHAEALRSDLPEGLSMPEAALRFVLSNPDVSTVIPGMRQPRHVASNLACSDLGPVPDDVLAKMRTHRWVREPTAWSQ